MFWLAAVLLREISAEGLTPEQYRSKDFSEFYVGCYWTLRLNNAVCDRSGRCFEAQVQAASLQEQLFRFYEERGVPPIEATQWALQVPESELLETFRMCPGLIATSLVFDATLRLPVDGVVASQARFSRAQRLLDSLDPEALETARRMFPLDLAIDRFHAELAALVEFSSKPSSTHYVVTRCRNSLNWFMNITIPSDATLHVYEKCGLSVEAGELEYIESVFSGFHDHQYTLDKQDGVMTGECAGYLQYIVDYYDELPENILFLHDDAHRHLKIPFLKILGKALNNRAFRSESPTLIHLNYYRVASLNTPCMQRVYGDIFGEELGFSRLSTYCCGQFFVSRDAVKSRSREFYADLLTRLRRNWDDVCKLGDMPCYVLEFLWQKVWTNSTMLPERKNDNNLPIFARHDYPDFDVQNANQYSPWFASQSAWQGD